MQVRDHVRFMVAYANAFRVMCPDEAPPKPYLATDFDLLAECDRCSLSAMGFQLHMALTSRNDRAGSRPKGTTHGCEHRSRMNRIASRMMHIGPGVGLCLSVRSQFTFTLQISLGSMF